MQTPKNTNFKPEDYYRVHGVMMTNAPRQLFLNNGTCEMNNVEFQMKKAPSHLSKRGRIPKAVL